MEDLKGFVEPLIDELVTKASASLGYKIKIYLNIEFCSKYYYKENKLKLNKFIIYHT